MAARRTLAEDIKQTRPFRSQAQEATVALLRTADVVRRRFSRIVEPAGITLQQYNVLRILRGAKGEPLSALEITARLIEEVPGVSRLIDRLVAKGFVRRDRSADDRRMLECYITPRGTALLASLDDAMDDADDQLGRLLTASGVDTLNRLLAQARGNDE